MRKLADALGVSIDSLVYADGLQNEESHNIQVMLQGKPWSYIMSVEKLIRTCIEEFPQTMQASNED